VATRTGTVVPGEVTEAPTVEPAPVRSRLHGVVRMPVTGEAVTGGARSVAAAWRGDARGRRSRPVSVLAVSDGGVIELFDGLSDAGLSAGRRRVKPLRGSSALLRPFG